jgi:uncharacterized protein DUF3558
MPVATLGHWCRSVGVRSVSAALGVLAVFVVTGCTTTSPGEPLPASNGETSSSDSPPSSNGGGQELPFAGAPKVDDPLDTTRFQQDPCQALTPDQAQSLGFPTEGKPRTAPLGKACTWENPESRGLVEIHFLDGNPSGLSGEYQANTDGKYAYFDPLPPIEGYPAVATDIVDDRDAGKCTVVVGVSDEVTFEVPIRLSTVNVGHKDPCQIAAMVAGKALQTMKED